MVVLLGQRIISLPVLIVVTAIALIGICMVSRIAGKKWGYTKEREKELEEMKNLR